MSEKSKTPYDGKYAKSKWGKILKKRKMLRKIIGKDPDEISIGKSEI